jgi:dihydrofolate synthase/folylpolyglutamate synthase
VQVERGESNLRGQDVGVRGPFGDIQVHTPLLGAFQVENVALAVTALAELRVAGFTIPDAAIRNGVASTRWPARLERIREAPTILVDGAHNRPAAEALAAAIQELFAGRKVSLVVGILNDKDLPGMAAALGALASHVYACRPKTPRAFGSDEVALAFRSYAESTSVPAVKDAVDAAISAATPEDIILITGSIYTAGEALDHLGARP